MASYISSNANRFYTALESAYGQAPTITATNRIPALKLTVRQQFEVTERKDKTGSRTFTGLPPGGRRQTTFELRTLLTNWQQGASTPSYGPLFQAALGAAPAYFAGGTAASTTGNGRLAFAAPHGLSAGQAVSSGGEIRFVAAIVDAETVQLCMAFSVPPAAGASVGAALTYTPTTELPSISIFDYWDPATAVQRLVCGCAVDQMEIDLNGDYHEFRFSGQAQDVVDSASFGSTTGAPQRFRAFRQNRRRAVSTIPLFRVTLGKRGWGPLRRNSSPLQRPRSCLRTDWIRGLRSSDRAFRRQSPRATGL